MIDRLFSNRKNYNAYLLGLILIAGAIFRFYNFPKRFGFDFDASRDALTASLMAKNLEIPLLGSLSSATSLNSGPWYYYYLAPFEAVFPLYGSWIFVVLSNTAFILAMYKVGEVLEDRKFGLLLALLVSLAPSQVILSNTLSNASPIPIFAAAAILFFILSIKKKNFFFPFFTAFFVSLGMNTHYQMIGFVIFPMLLLLFQGNRLKNLILLSLGFVIPFLPTIIYDLRNNFVSFKAALSFLTSSNDIYYVPNRWLSYVSEFWPNSWSFTLGVPLWLTFLIGGIFTILIIILLVKRNIKKEYLLILIAFVADFILLRYFPQEKRIYYLYYLYPFIFIFSGYLIYKLSQNKKLFHFALLLLALIIIFMIKKDLKILNPDEYHVQLTSQEHILLSQYPNEVFNIYSCRENADKGMGLTYLLQKKGKSSGSGRKIGLANKTCGTRENFKKIDNTTLFELEGSDKELAAKDWFSISVKSMEEVKSMQLYRSY